MGSVELEHEDWSVSVDETSVRIDIEKALLPPNPGEGMLSSSDWSELARYLQLSARETKVAVLIFEGNSRSQIAQKMDCAPGTVRCYIDRVFAKLNAEDRLGTVLRIVRIHRILVAQRRKSACSH